MRHRKNTCKAGRRDPRLLRLWVSRQKNGGEGVRRRFQTRWRNLKSANTAADGGRTYRLKSLLMQEVKERGCGGAEKLGEKS